MFGGGGDWRSALMAAGAAMMSRRNPQMATGIMQMMMLKQRQAQEEAHYERERHDKQDDWRTQYDYEVAHPKPVNNDTSADYDFWQQHLSPEKFQEYVSNKVNPPQYMQVPGLGIVQIPRSGGQAGPPTAPVGKLRPLGAGGPSPSGSGGFL
jgi:hypothetical protein